MRKGVSRQENPVLTPPSLTPRYLVRIKCPASWFSITSSAVLQKIKELYGMKKLIETILCKK